MESTSSILLPQPKAEAEISPAKVILERRRIRANFRAWCEYRMAKMGRAPALHHLLIIDTVEKLLAGQLSKRNVILLMPPGSAKSTYTSVLLPSWFLNPQQFPNDLMLACSYSYTLIEGFGKQARDIVNEEKKVLGISVSTTSAAAGDWRTNRGGGYFCAGVNAGIAGHRARLGFIDDYLGTEAEADSKVIREGNWKWYWNDFLPRLLPDAWQFIIANRRHEDDLVGRLIKEDPNNWLVISIPMEAESDDDVLGRKKGDRLWPEWFTAEQVRLAKKIPRTWAGLYQQRPAPEEGDYFKSENILTYRPNELPRDLRLYAGSDWALRKGQANDSTCHLIAGIDTNGRMWILPDWFWDKVDTLQATDEMFRLAKLHKPITWWHGRENITGSIGPFINKRMVDEQVFIPIEELSESNDKQAKAQSIKARMAAKMVMFPEFQPQWSEALHQLLTFPAGQHDDFVDALAKLGQGLSSMVKSERSQPDWDGIIPEQRITCGWIQRSHKKLLRAATVSDN